MARPKRTAQIITIKRPTPNNTTPVDTASPQKNETRVYFQVVLSQKNVGQELMGRVTQERVEIPENCGGFQFTAVPGIKYQIQQYLQVSYADTPPGSCKTGEGLTALLLLLLLNLGDVSEMQL